ncbi:MAG TPA: creatininase family protein [Candidatus Binatia bacterium]|nr:creatininase family protein [Candidatus Binatia bacterium]
MPVVRGEDLTYNRIRELDPRRAIAFLPVSALEVHGPHLPLGQDTAMARWMAEETARRFAARHEDWTVAIFPALTIGSDEIPLRGSMEAPPRALYRILLSHGRSLARAGFGTVIVTNGHGGPRHAAALEAACRVVSRRARIRMVTPSIAVLHRVITGGRHERLAELLGRPLDERERRALLIGEHAGAWETSFMLAESPELVDPGYRALGPLAPPLWRPLHALGARLVARRERRGRDATRIRTAFDGLALAIGWWLNARYGYGGREVTYKGDPSVASAEIGHAFREILAEDCLDVADGVATGRIAPELVRSVASDHAVIRPGFFAKIGLAAAILLAILAW